MRLRVAAILLGVALLAAACGGRHTFNGAVYDPVIPAPELRGINKDGTPFAMSDLKGKVVLLFFGYTFCPDICPLALADMKAVKADLGERARDVAFVFVSVDPDRDTPAQLAAYVQAFDPAFYGVHVPPDDLDPIKRGYGVFAEKRVLDDTQSAAGYFVDHTGWTYLIDKQGDLRAVYDMSATPANVAADVAYLAGR
jgi:protein SCO1